MRIPGFVADLGLYSVIKTASYQIWQKNVHHGDDLTPAYYCIPGLNSCYCNGWLDCVTCDQMEVWPCNQTGNG